MGSADTSIIANAEKTANSDVITQDPLPDDEQLDQLLMDVWKIQTKSTGS